MTRSTGATTVGGAEKTTAVKRDMLKELGELYRPRSDRPSVVEVPPLRFLMIDGEGDPNTSGRYAAAIETLYALSYGMKFRIRRSMGVDYKVMPLEGLWWADDMASFAAGRRHEWLWTAMIAQPEIVTAELLEDVGAETARKKPLTLLEEVRLESLTEGPSAQIMHLGPYSQEGPTIERLHAFIADEGYVMRGKHHEIYLGDPRRAAPDRLRTVIRQPVETGPRSSH